jgi:hypothetical protein
MRSDLSRRRDASSSSPLSWLIRRVSEGRRRPNAHAVQRRRRPGIGARIEQALGQPVVGIGVLGAEEPHRGVEILDVRVAQARELQGPDPGSRRTSPPSGTGLQLQWLIDPTRDMVGAMDAFFDSIGATARRIDSATE